MGQIILLPLRRKACRGFLTLVKKIQRLRPGLNPRTREPEASMLTTRPPKPSTHMHNTYSLLLHNSLIPPDLVKCFTATLIKSVEMSNDLTVITICLTKLYVYTKPRSKKILFCFIAASGNLREDLGTFHCCRRQLVHKSIVVQLAITFSPTTHTESNVLSTATMAVQTRHNVTLYVHRLSGLLLEKGNFGKL
jgi:hypothetical protein